MLAGAVAALLAALDVFVLQPRHMTTVTPLNANLLALVSSRDGTVRATVPLRAGNYQHNPVWCVLLDQLWVR